jgi:hypothetical protein
MESTVNRKGNGSKLRKFSEILVLFRNKGKGKTVEPNAREQQNIVQD